MRPRPAPSPARRRLGVTLLVVGLLVIVASVLWVLEVANGPGAGPPRAFAERRSYDQVKESVHESFPLGFGVAMVGLGLAYVGKRLATASPDVDDA